MAIFDGPGGKGSAPAQRPRELQDPLNHFVYHPLAWRLARRLAATPITPNMVSLFGACMVILASAAYAGLPYPSSVGLGLLLHLSWHVIDGADGDLARLTGRSSPIGEMVDGLCDYLSHVVLYLVMGWVLTRIGGWSGGWNAWALIVFAGISHAVQANHVEVQRRQYQYWVYGTRWIRNSHEGQDSATGKSVFGSLVSAYLGVATGMTPYALQVDAAVEAAQGNRAALDRIAQIAREETQPLLLLCKILGPNPRALVLGLSMFAGSPAYYMVYQSVVLNLLLVWSVNRHNAAAKRIAARIAG